MKNETAMRFVADAMLGRLATWLRLSGYDTLYWRGDDARLVRLVLAENRLLLTRDTHLPPRLPPHLICLIESDHYDAQLGQVVARFGLSPQIGRLCARCNLPLEPADKTAVRAEVPPFVWQTQERFARCPGCLRIYWEGTHYARMLETLDRLPGRQTGVAAMRKENSQCA
ncbi:MAG: hypothetical protein F9K13_11075 [Candidatus Methylomirabilis oxygeniifera]|nr:MAG: hypothetical protein F9K13_11075 [Candidatus Methylomirabilis oxyfera]